VDIVIFTHPHVDHFGRNTRLIGDRWVPPFPNARYYFSRAECAQCLAAGIEDINAGTYNDSVRPIVDADLAHPTDGEFEVRNGVSIEPAPGRALGHVVARCRSRGFEGLMTGDVNF
jgi:glyoxylase-like metal-dependent hydrolase (beta-lactamase superfamily II)